MLLRHMSTASSGTSGKSEESGQMEYGGRVDRVGGGVEQEAEFEARTSGKVASDLLCDWGRDGVERKESKYRRTA